MFKIEKLLKICETELPTLNFNVLFDDDGYRISISNNGHTGNYRKERNTFIKVIDNINNLHVIKICDGTEYIIKVLVILDTAYNQGNMTTIVETLTRTLFFEHIYREDYISACEKYNLPQYIEE